MSGIRRARKNHIRRTAAGVASDIESRAAGADRQVARIRADERYTGIFFSYTYPPLGQQQSELLTYDRKRLEREMGYFWWYAGLGGASGIFFKV